MYHKMAIYQRLCCVVLMLTWLSMEIAAISNNTLIEQQLETEFDLREPRSFSDRNTEYLVVRNVGFDKISHYTKDGIYINTDRISNWERFALNYWFETRTPYSSCEMMPLGVSTNFDWALMIPCMFGNPHKPPSTIFVHNYMLSHFIESTLHFMDPSYRFVLVSGGTDMTIPRSAGDQRYHLMRGFAQGPDGGSYFQKLVNDPRLIHWFCENRDLAHPKLSTLPTGLIIDIHDQAVKDMPTNLSLLSSRPLKILVSDRIREGTGQWATRKLVADMCDALPDYCMRPAAHTSEGVSHKDFVNLVASVPFVACAHGGGMDPSPKAWESIMVGSIPIIRRSVLDDAYKHLPVAFVDSWEQLLQPANSTAMEALLKGWIEQLQPYYLQGSALRKRTLDRLKTAYWMEQVHHKVREYHKLDALRNPQSLAVLNGTAGGAAEGAETATNTAASGEASGGEDSATQARLRHLRAGPGAGSSSADFVGSVVGGAGSGTGTSSAVSGANKTHHAVGHHGKQAPQHRSLRVKGGTKLNRSRR